MWSIARWSIAFLLLVVSGCSGPGDPNAGGLVVAVSGLPGGVSATISVTGPEGFARELAGSELFAALAPGSYTVSAALVRIGDVTYAPSAAMQTVTVVPNTGPVTVSVKYLLAIGRMKVQVSGLPPGAAANVEVTGPGTHQIVTANTTLSGLPEGAYTVAATSVTAGGTLYNPSPASQVIEVGSTITLVPVTVAYQASATNHFNLTIDGMYVVQSVQSYTGTVPLIAHRDGLLRVFVVANGPNAARPAVRVRLYRNGTLVSTETILASGVSAPVQVDEGRLSASWNLTIPAALMQPGLAVLAEVDPGGMVDEGNEGDNAFPVSGAPRAMAVRTVSTLPLRFVPVYQSTNGRQGNVNVANMSSFMTTMRAVHPIQGINADVRAVYTTSAAPLEADDDAAWTQVLSEVNALRVADADAGSRHYYGVVKTVHASGIAGLGYIGGRAAVGWDYLPSGANVAAHELGHNWGRQHAPCGNVSTFDGQYPYSGGSIGVFGFDPVTATVKSRFTTDLMGYCHDQWISDYTYMGIMNYRDSPSLASVAAAPEPGLLVWGKIVDGEPVLEPAFEIIARPSLPRRAGPYIVEGRGSDGAIAFSLSFEAETVVDGNGTHEHFAFVVPLASMRTAGLDRLTLRTPNRAAALAAPRPGVARFRIGPAPGEAMVRRLAGGRVSLRWNASAHPVVMVRDPADGRVLSFARGGDAEVVTTRNELELVASNRVRSERVRVTVRP